MQQDDAKNLEEQFGNLFTNSQSDLAETEPKARNPHSQHQRFSLVTFQQMPYTETQSDEDFLDQVDQVLDHAVEGQGEPNRREVMLNFKINELKEVCKRLKTINVQLKERIRQLEELRPSESHIESSISIEASKGDLTAIQQDFVQLQSQLKSYKDQLSSYQHKMAEECSQKQKQIDKLQVQLLDLNMLRKAVEEMSQSLADKNRVIAMLEKRNEQLLLELEERQEDEEEWSGRNRGNRDYFNEKISSEMESMIDKLIKELKIEKKISNRQIAQIKRLNAEIMELESTVKVKNKKIYELEFSLIKINKINQEKYSNQISSKEYFKEKDRSPKKNDYSDSSSSFQREDPQPYLSKYQKNPYMLPQKRPEKDQGSKNRSHQTNRSYDKNRMSAERETPAQNIYFPQSRLRINPPLNSPLNKPLSFTLMDLLNKEFKIREVQKEVIACRIIDIYSQKIMQQSYENLIPQQIQIYNFIPQKLSQIKVRINLMNKGEQESITEQKLLYNMAFILDNLLAQVEVVDAYVQRPLELNISDYITQLQNKPSREQKYKLLQELTLSIEQYALQQ